MENIPYNDYDVLYNPPVAQIAPYNPQAEAAESRASTRGTARQNLEIRTPRPTTSWTTSTTSTTSGLEGTTLNITEVRSLDLDQWEDLANQGAAANQHLVLYQEGNVVTAQWEPYSDIE